jgi:hypothetical protein
MRRYSYPRNTTKRTVNEDRGIMDESAIVYIVMAFFTIALLEESDVSLRKVHLYSHILIVESRVLKQPVPSQELKPIIQTCDPYTCLCSFDYLTDPDVHLL